jgi:hypothetical protein
MPHVAETPGASSFLDSFRYSQQLGSMARHHVELRLGSGDSLPKLNGSSFAAGSISFPPASISFIAILGANNAACK